MAFADGQIENVTCCSIGTSPMPILKATCGSCPIMAEISGTRPQKRDKMRGLIVARVSAANGPFVCAVVGSNGVTPDHCPRADWVVKKTDQLSAARPAKRANTPSFVRDCAVAISGHVATMAKTRGKTTGVNPSPFRERQGFQNRMSRWAANCRGLPPITQRPNPGAESPGNRKTKRETVSSPGKVPKSQILFN